MGWRCFACRFENHELMVVCEMCSTPKGEQFMESKQAAKDELSIEGVFSNNMTAEYHYRVFAKTPRQYMGYVLALMKAKVSLTSATRGRVLAVAWALGERNFVDFLFQVPGYLDVGEILKACQILDARRFAAQAEKRLAGLKEKTQKSKAKATHIRAELQRRNTEVLESGCSLTSSFSKRVKNWASQIPAEELLFRLLNFPPDHWRQLSDYVHFSKKTFSLPYFLASIFGEEFPSDSLARKLRDLNADELVGNLAKHPEMKSMFSYLRTLIAPSAWPVEAKAMFAKDGPLEEVLWWYHEIHCPEAEKAVHSRLESGEMIGTARSRANFGKLMERLLVFMDKGYTFAKFLLPYCEDRLKKIHLPKSDKRIAVIGDASGSMEVAIRSATILGGLLSASLDAELSFFNSKPIHPSIQPKTAAEVVRVAQETRATGTTAPAAGLLPYLKAKKPVDLFIVVTDEMENRYVEGRDFAQTMEEYRRVVAAGAEVYFVTFISNTMSRGPMQVALNRRGIPCQQFKVDPACPDLSKFDTLLGQLSLKIHGVDTLAHVDIPSPVAGSAQSETKDEEASSGMDGSVDLDALWRRTMGGSQPSEGKTSEGNLNSLGGGGGGSTKEAAPMPEAPEEDEAEEGSVWKGKGATGGAAAAKDPNMEREKQLQELMAALELSRSQMAMLQSKVEDLRRREEPM